MTQHPHHQPADDDGPDGAGDTSATGTSEAAASEGAGTGDGTEGETATRTGSDGDGSGSGSGGSGGGTSGLADTSAPDADSHENTLTVILALAANLGIAVAKTAAAFITGSASMAAEAAHSVADTFNEVLLMIGLRRSGRPADRRHPLGYGKERYIWTLLVAVAIFGMGALFAFYQGVQTLLGHPTEADPLVGYIVLAVSFVLEGTSWRQALRQIRGAARDEGLTLFTHIRRTDDPTSVSVLLEDSAALTGLLIAFAGLGLHQLTGSSAWDGVGSILIGVLLTAVALILGRINLNLLIGNQADPRIVADIRGRLGAAPEIDWVVDIVTLTFGADQILVCARLDFRDALSAADVERACVRMSRELHDAHEEVFEVFLEPVPRDDPDLRERVIARYGRALPQNPGHGAPPLSET
ncbi:cation diffusion facilitator family transporter [Actinomadura rupiterrae]|uniref:cation diffusion facilitator family transporter n=1 Tax=Actinomadura rupiterrae TaxID=559627 RepID=UPI0020A23CA1|nr:cation diffusion facilitator family transporter [Actinomadura rupiterrae]MCP2342639.1 cation diffusion facilitator family transporter [Actinomadura rupiterrae]